MIDTITRNTSNRNTIFEYMRCIEARSQSLSCYRRPTVSGSEGIMEVTGNDPPKTVLNHRCQIHGGKAAYEPDESLKAEAERRFSCRVTAFGLQSGWRAGPTIRASEKAAAEDWLELYGDQYPPNPPISNDGRPICKGDPGCAVTS